MVSVALPRVTGGWLIGYGAAMVVAAWVGWLISQDHPTSSLSLSLTCLLGGLLAMALGAGVTRGQRWAVLVAAAAVAALLITFGARAAYAWLDATGQRPQRWWDATLTTALMVATVATLARLGWHLRRTLRLTVGNLSLAPP